MPKTTENPYAIEAEKTQRRLRAEFYAREQEPKRLAAHERFLELGVKVGAHEVTEEPEETAPEDRA